MFMTFYIICNVQIKIPLIIKCIILMFIHTLSDLVGEMVIILLNTCLRNNITFNDFVFCDLQNVEMS